MLQHTPKRLNPARLNRPARPAYWTALWSFFLALALLFTLSFIATPLRILPGSEIDVRQIVAGLRAGGSDLARGLETHGIGWLFMKPVDRLNVNRDPQYLAAITRTVCVELKLSPELVTAVMEVGSGLDPLAVSSSGALGLMQLSKQDVLEAKLNSAFDPWENITAGSRKLRGLIEKHHGNWEVALREYYSTGYAAGNAPGISDDRELTRLVNKTLEVYRAEVALRYPSLS